MITLRQFLEEVPTGKLCDISEIVYPWLPKQSNTLALTPIRIYCDSVDCKHEQMFSANSDFYHLSLAKDDWHFFFLEYHCRNCGTSTKVFAVRLRALDDRSGQAIKLGEHPPFGSYPLGKRLSSVLSHSRDIYIQGIAAERQGMGIGAFAYYRRVVDNQRAKILDAVIDVAKAEGSPEKLIIELEAAKCEMRFSDAAEKIGRAVPQALYIDGHSPLTLLYKALSKGIHEMSDSECLEKAHHIRLVLTDLLNRVEQLVTENKELKGAVASLTKPHTDG